jgi:hypothetical protein
MKTNIKTNSHSPIIHQAVEWTGHSGTHYRYYIWPRGAKIEGAPPGNFLHVKVAEDGTLVPVYIAQTEDLNRRLLSPEERECIDAEGATQLHIHISYKGEKERMEEEADLVARWLPVCNSSLHVDSLRLRSLEEAMHLRM